MFFALCFGSLSYPAGQKPKFYKDGDELIIYANSIRSPHRPIPYDYFFNNVMCRNNNKLKYINSLSEYLTGEAIKDTPMKIKIGSEAECSIVCTKNISQVKKVKLIKMIDQKYRYNYLIDDFPVTVVSTDNTKGTSITPGVDIGYVDEYGKHYLNNYIEFTVDITPYKQDGTTQIVGVEATSVLSKVEDDCDPKTTIALEDMTNVTFTYSVKFQTTKTSWEMRWDQLFSMNYNPKTQWISLGTILMLVAIQTIIIAGFLLRTVKIDFLKYSRILEDDDDPLEETGWKLIHGDVFRKPSNSVYLFSAICSGTQLTIGLVIGVLLASVGIISPITPASNVSKILVIILVGAPIGGFASGRLFRAFGVKEWKKFILYSCFIFIIPSGCAFFIIQIIQHSNNSASTLPAGKIISLILISLLNVVLCAAPIFVGFNSNPIELPARVNQLPRQIPKQPSYLKPSLCAAFGGALVSSMTLVQLHLLLEALYAKETFYHMGLILLIVVLAMLLTAAEVSVFMTYLRLTREDYHWWWPSFVIPAASGAYVFAYALYYIFTGLRPADLASAVVAIAGCAAGSWAVALANGAVGFFASYLFVRRLFGSLKME